MFNEAVNLISTVGFPIAGCIFLGWYSMKTNDKVIDLTKSVTSALVASSDAMKEQSETMKELKDVILSIRK